MQLLGNLASPNSAFRIFFPGLDLIEAFICKADLLIEIRLDELERFSAGFENDVVEFRDRHAWVQYLEHIPRSDWSYINHRGQCLPIYCEEVYDYGKGVVLDTFNIMRCPLP